MQKKRVPKRLWDFGLVVESKILTRMARRQDLRTGYEEVTGQTADISAWLDFGFYDLVYSYDRPNKPDVYDDVEYCNAVNHEACVVQPFLKHHIEYVNLLLGP